MKNSYKLLSLFVLAVLLFIPFRAAHANGLSDGQVIFGNSYTLKSGETQNGDVVIFGGMGKIEEGALLNGALVLIGGSLEVAGEVTGDILVVGGSVSLASTAQIAGDMVTMGAVLQRADGALVQGEVILNASGGNVFPEGTPTIITTPQIPTQPVRPTNAWINLPYPLEQALGAFFRSLAMALLAMLVTLFLARPTDYISNAVASQPAVAGGLGLLTVFLFPLFVLLLVITLILIPVAALAVLVLALAIVFGWLAIGLEVGQRLMAAFKAEWALPVAAAVGTFLLTLVMSVVAIVPWVGWLAPFAIAMMGLGGVLMTRFGARVVLSAPVVSGIEAPKTPPPPSEPVLPHRGRKVAADTDELLPPAS